jgi:maltose alpha-D-glucosyltransferase/alpha-amylase
LATITSLQVNSQALSADALWYKDAIIYETHVRAFCDSSGDGIGDFRGLAEKIDYLQDLGVTAIWLLPFYPSPLKDDGYDIADYGDVHPNYGTLADFKTFLREAHRRGLKVITELVLNHTSDQHPWFQRARRAPAGSNWRNFYVWSDTAEKYKDARIIFKDFEASNWTWDPVANAYYWHRFYHHQPDLNYENPQVRRVMTQVMNFWLGLGVDGLRLDAVPYLYEREGTNCENLAETHLALEELRSHVDQRYPNRMLLAEANQWPEDAIAYFGAGNECHMAFHFPLMPRMFMAVRMEDRFPIIDILKQTPPIPANCQWALFLRNHDELTLEMVTDEERDYMYRVYADDPHARINLGIRRRLHPLLGKDWNKIELMNGLLFSLPGTPVVYYGDEIGMGDNIFLGDRNGVRTPMQWSSDRNAGFSRANPQSLYLPVIIDSDYHYEVVNVETQQNNPSSYLWWMKRLIAMRKRLKSLGHGSLEFLYPENRKVLAYIRRYGDEAVLVVANLSRLSQYARLDLTPFRGMVPVEQFGQTEFPPIAEDRYFVTLGPYGFYWFSLKPQRGGDVDMTSPAPGFAIPELAVAVGWDTIFESGSKEQLEAVLPNYLARRRWFGGKARHVERMEIIDAIPIRQATPLPYVALIRVLYTEGDPETYMLPLSFASGEEAAGIEQNQSPAVVARLNAGGTEGILYAALLDKGLPNALLGAIGNRRRFKGEAGNILGLPAKAFRTIRGPADLHFEPAVMQTEQSNTSIVYGDRLILKLFRKLDPGINPDVEISAFLTERTSFTNLPPLAGTLVYRRGHDEPLSVGILQAFVPNQGDAWKYTLDILSQYFDQAAARLTSAQAAAVPGKSLLQLMEEEPPQIAQDLIGGYLESARVLGQRTAQLHLALASDTIDPSFAPEPFSILYQRSIYQSMRNLAGNMFGLLAQNREKLPDTVREAAKRVLELENVAFDRFRALLDHKIDAYRTRMHGDLHLGQVLTTGKDFVIIDFEGEPARAISERRIKRSPLRDVAGMVRSFHYATYSALFRRTEDLGPRAEEFRNLEAWGRIWYSWVSSVFLKSYFHTMGDSQIHPRAHTELDVMLRAYLLEKAFYEIGYELNNRPDWLRIPLQGILQLLEPVA